MKILLPVDGSDYSRSAIDFVASRSTLIGTEPDVQVMNVQLMVPVRAARAVGKAALAEYYTEESDKVLKPALRRLARAGLHATPRALIGSAGAEIAAAATAGKVDLIIMGSHGRSAFKGLLMGSVTSAVLARSRSPMLVLRGRNVPTADTLKVGIAVDGSKYGMAAVKYVLRHAALFGTKPDITVIHVASDFAAALIPDMSGIALPPLSDAELRTLQKKSFEAAVAPVRRLLARAGVTASEVCLVGNPGDELSAYAKKKLDVLVMGSHGYGAFKAAVMGSVATRVMARSTVPLLLIRQA